MRIDALLVDALRSCRPEVPELGRARLELERRRLLARIASEGPARTAEPVAAFRLRWAAAALTALVAVGLAVAVYTTRGGDAAVSLSGVWKLESGDAIARGAVIRVPDGENAALELDDGTVIAAAGGAALRFEQSRGVTIELIGGRIALDVAKRRDPSHPFVVSTDFGDVAVLGTVFAVNADPHSTAVRLYEGRVRLSAAGREIALTEGHMARATADGISSLGELTEEERRADLALLAPHSKRGFARQREVAIAQPEEPISSASQPRAEVPTAAPAPAVTRPVQGEAQQRTAGATGGTDAVAKVAALWRDKRYADVIAATDAPGTKPEALLYRGKALGALGRWREAGEVFARIAEAGGDLGREATYLSAAAFDTAADFARGLEMARRAAGSGGPNADHAARLVFVSLTGLGRYEDAANAAREYLEQRPGGAHVAEARFAVSTGARLERRWAAAADEYAAFLALGHGTPQMRDDAAFYVGYCRLKAGATASGREGLERYLSSYPTGRHAEQARAALSN